MLGGDIIPKIIDLTSMTFGRLKVIKSDGIDKFGNKLWKCNCECGNNTRVSSYNLKSKRIKSCGCLAKELSKIKIEKVRPDTTTHGLSNHKLYHIWNMMKYRCHNPNSKNYKRYGERGIEVCDKWANDFESFYKWSINNGYKEGLTIDRIDNSKGYNPNNCRWATWKQQANNKGY